MNSSYRAVCLLALLQLILGTVATQAQTVSLSAQAPPTLGQLEATYPTLRVNEFVVDPTKPYLYASVASQNSIAMINTNTLALENMIFIGSNPNGLALSADGSRLYVANAGSNTIGILDTVTRTALPSLTVPQVPYDVEVGADGRLFVLGTNTLIQINPTTGASVAPNITGASFRPGELEISPNKDRLYFADYGVSPASLYQFDVTVNPPVKLWESPHGGTSGSNGQDLTISHDGSFISYPCGAGQIGYSIAKYNTSNMSIAGSFNTGAYPREIAFSPNDDLAYTVHTAGQIELWDTTTFLSLGSFPTSGTNVSLITELQVDQSGRHLFAAYSDSYYGNYELRAYSTGLNAIPEPSVYAVVVLSLAGLVYLRSRISRPKMG